MPPVRIAYFVSFFVGFLSLSQEILWVRMVGFAHSGSPHAFSLVLTAFLIGIAIGALVGRRRCRTSTNLRQECGYMLMLAGVVDTLCLFAIPLALAQHGASMLVAGVMIAATAGAKGVIFPIVHQLGTPAQDARIGRAVSKVYIFNVLGSTLGPIVCGFFAMQWYSAATLFALIGFLCVCAGVVLAFGAAAFAPRNRLISGLAVVIALLAVTNRFDPLHFIASRPHAASIVSPMLQNRQGIVHLASANDKGGAFTYGGNIYDGRINIDLSINSNRIDRVYIMGLLHPSPKRVLVTGLSTGAWTRVILGFPGIEQIDVVEINPAYIELIRHLPEIAPILNDPRVKIHIDDGRRWLRANPEKRYDLIFQNTTFHWRAYASMLLSRDYFAEVKKHLTAGGVATFNTTDSLDVYHTAQVAFGHAIRYVNFVYVSNQPLSRRPDAEAFLRAARIDNVPAVDASLFAPGKIAHALLYSELEPVEKYLARHKSAVEPGIISDMNLLSELRHGRPGPIPALRSVLPPRPSLELSR